jgi:hypothetical protein
MWICELGQKLGTARRPRWGRGVTLGARLAGFALLAIVTAERSAWAQTGLGSQREGTSSATFLRIGVGARAQGMGGTFVAVADDPSAIYWNPAGLASLQTREVSASHVDWPADVKYDHLTLVLPSRRLGGSIGLQFGALTSRIQETTDLEPFGTGNEFTYSDVVVGGSFARRWTDKLLVGAGAKYVREDLGSQVGGPTTNAILFDAGSIFYLGLGSIRIAAALTNFGPEMRPGGGYTSPYTGEQRQYDGFDPPMTFRFGAAFEPVENATQRVTLSMEMGQPADNQLQIQGGAEWSYRHMFALRTGYDATADLMKFSAGAGFVASFGTLRGALDYAFTDAGDLGAVQRVSLGVRF